MGKSPSLFCIILVYYYDVLTTSAVILTRLQVSDIDTEGMFRGIVQEREGDTAARLSVILYDAVTVKGSLHSRIEDQVIYACERASRKQYSYVQVVSERRAEKDLPALPNDPVGQLVCIFELARVEKDGPNRPPIEKDLFAVVLHLEPIPANVQDALFTLVHESHGHRGLFKAYKWGLVNPILRHEAGVVLDWVDMKRSIVPMSRIRPTAVVPVYRGVDYQAFPVLGNPTADDMFFHVPQEFTDRYKIRRWEGPQAYPSITSRRRNLVTGKKEGNFYSAVV